MLYGTASHGQGTVGSVASVVAFPVDTSIHDSPPMPPLPTPYSSHAPDERFYTPRAQAPLSSRSATSASVYITPRSSRGEVHSARSFSSTEFITPRSINSARIGESSIDEQERDYHRQQQQYAGDFDLEPGVADNDKIIGDLFSLARHGKSEDVNKILLKGVPVDSRDSNGNTILSVGCQNNSKRIVKLALRYGADMNATNARGNTALHFCYKYGFGETLGAYLISKGADQTIRNFDGRLPQEEGQSFSTSYMSP